MNEVDARATDSQAPVRILLTNDLHQRRCKITTFRFSLSKSDKKVPLYCIIIYHSPFENSKIQPLLSENVMKIFIKRITVLKEHPKQTFARDHKLCTKKCCTFDLQ